MLLNFQSIVIALVWCIESDLINLWLLFRIPDVCIYYYSLYYALVLLWKFNSFCVYFFIFLVYATIMVN